MKRVLVLALALFVAPMAVSAQVEIGLDGGFNITSIDDVDDNVTTIAIPAQWARVGFAAGEMLLIESLLSINYESQGDFSETTILLMPGLNYLLGEQFYIRGEAGLIRFSESPTDFSFTQYGFGGGAGIRVPLGDAALFRAEVAVDRFLEVTDNNIITAAAHTDIRGGVGISAVIN